MSLAEVEPLIRRYFDALYHADAELMNSVMHPAAVYATADEKAPLIRNMQEYLDVLRAREGPAARGEARSDEIVSVEFAGRNTAMARVRCSIGERHFTDFLSLIRAAEGWQIIAKVFAIDFNREEAPACRS